MAARKAASSTKLTPKQEKFCQLYVELGNASAAYRNAYDCKKFKPERINTEACELLKSPKISRRVEELQAKHAERHDITVDSLTEKALAAYSLAITEKQSAAAVTALAFLGKLHGLVIEKKHVTGDHKHHHTSEPVSESAAWLAGVLGRPSDRAASQSLPH